MTDYNLINLSRNALYLLSSSPDDLESQYRSLPLHPSSDFLIVYPLISTSLFRLVQSCVDMEELSAIKLSCL